MYPNRGRHAKALGRRQARERDFVQGEDSSRSSQQRWSRLGRRVRYLPRTSHFQVSLMVIELLWLDS